MYINFKSCMIAHRGLKTFENKTGFFPCVLKRPNIRGIEFDVHRNSKRELVITHEYLDRNKLSSEPLTMLPKFDKTKLILDIKTFNSDAIDIARDVVHETRFMMDDHEWYLCSFNKKCVNELVKLNEGKYKCGQITNGYMLGWPVLKGTDFISLYWGYITRDKVKYYHNKGMKVFAWTVPHDKVEDLREMGVDEIIVDIY